jgi:hypothetical protein
MITMDKMDNPIPVTGRKKLFNAICIIAMMTVLFSCDNFLDIVPDNTADVERAFTMRAQAEKFLYTTYSYLPNYSTGIVNGSPGYSAFLTSQEWWASFDTEGQFVKEGSQRVVDPYFNYWEGRNNAPDMNEAIRQCNVFIENIDGVGDMSQAEKDKWKAEVTFLKAYYHFFLIRMYGPVILYNENVNTGAAEDQIKVARAPVDSAFNYVLTLMDEAISSPELPARVANQSTDYGRITKSIAYALKARVAVFAASPLYDGNEQYSSFRNVNGDNPFDVEQGAGGDPMANWKRAADATKEAVDFIESNNFQFYTFQSSASRGALDDSTTLKMTIRNTLAEGEGNVVRPNLIWAQASNNIGSGFPQQVKQRLNLPRGLNNVSPVNAAAWGSLAPPLKIVEKYYSENGLPIDQDNTYDYTNRYQVETVAEEDRFYLREGYTTAKLNFDREPRYYANLFFDGGIYYGNGYFTGGVENYGHIRARDGQINSLSTQQGQYFSLTGYWVKKLVNYQTTLEDDSFGTDVVYYSWPIMRLADLYLLHAEATNEVNGPGAEVYSSLNRVRANNGLPTVEESWSEFGNGSAWNHTSKDGLRQIIHRERTLELMFEGHYYWDVRRWKTAPEELPSAIMGWSRSSSDPEQYYRPTAIFQPSFELKDYLWPISEQELLANPQLTQNPGW